MTKQEAINVIKLLESLIEIAEASKILSTFISAFLNKSILKADGVYYLHGNFNPGGTVSGRLSSSGPNLQNIPSSGTKYAKIIKMCFVAPPGWLLVGADYSSLEDRISALTTKDPNKLKVYIDGYDGHCLRAYAYFPDRLPGIVDTVESINSIEVKFPDIRQESKAPTFALTYQGTWHTLVNNCGIPEQEAKEIELRYHNLYRVSDEWVQNKLIQASKDGFVTVAFGLRVRTPILAQVVMNTRSTPYEAQAEGRTAGNALGQSYGLLNSRAGVELENRLRASSELQNILAIAQIHDSQYFLVKNQLHSLKWLNKHLVECMEWQELDEIKHDKVKLGGKLEVYYPSWATKYTIPNHASKREIFDICHI